HAGETCKYTNLPSIFWESCFRSTPFAAHAAVSLAIICDCFDDATSFDFSVCAAAATSGFADSGVGAGAGSGVVVAVLTSDVVAFFAFIYVIQPFCAVARITNTSNFKGSYAR